MLMSNIFATLTLVGVLLQTSVVAGQICTRGKVGLRDCSAGNCYRCTISSSNDYAGIPPNAVAINLAFSSGSTGLESTARLPSLVELRELEMSLSNLGLSPVIPSGFFSAVGQLEVLTIFHNVHSSIEFGARLVNGSFSGLSNLTRLNAAALGIAELPVDVFKDLVNLRQLDLNQNRLTEVAAGTFAEQRQLITLSLARNKLSSVVNVSFEGLNSLRTIDLYNNEIRSLGRGLDLLPLGNLTDLNLASNQMVQIDSYAFTGLRKLERLFLDDNNLTNLTANVFEDLTNLALLDLRRNALPRLPVSLFSSLPSLQMLDLSENRIESVPADVFDGLPKLKTLDLRKNLIESVEDRGFDGLESLEKLYLSENWIAEVGPDAFPSLRRLELLDLSSNRLTSLEIGTMDGFDVRLLSHLDLSLNPWNCSCDIYWLVLWLQMHNLTSIVVKPDSTTCESPAEWRNQTLLAAYDDNNHSCPFPFPVETTQTTVSLTLNESSLISNEEGLSEGGKIGIIVAAVVVAVAIIILVAVVVLFRLKATGFWDRKQSESANGLHLEAGMKGNAAASSKIVSNGGYDNRGVITDDVSGQGSVKGQGHSYVYDNPTLLDDGAHI